MHTRNVLCCPATHVSSAHFLDPHPLSEMFVVMLSPDWHPSPENACHNSHLM